ncbi:hypothetical protein LWC35_31585 [Pseudonocardia kujensis]|uniref:hypothetical protein n=1 Tax=Pseudonocardia kujensis TaxID=1128675 RepID=UPI001E643028|nr:hypothetical protein [Pseudonocardia kujensis]MCE0767409.1 hypothetical protein [Pseudonocardia kujensis]
MWAQHDTSYPPNRFEQAIAEMSGEDACSFTRKLIISADPDGALGFRRLAELGQLWWSVEACVLRARWRELFDEPLREAARFRLSQAGIPRPDEFANRPASNG